MTSTMTTKMVRFLLLLTIAAALLIGDTTGFCSQRISPPHFPRDANLQARRQQEERSSRRSLLESTLAAAYFSCFLPSSANAAIDLVPTTKLRTRSKHSMVFRPADGNWHGRI